MILDTNNAETIRRTALRSEQAEYQTADSFSMPPS